MPSMTALSHPSGLQPGDRAPDFRLPASGGRTVSSAALLGKPYLLYFYPKADTPGCTTQACGLQDVLPKFDADGLTIIGVSLDPVAKIDKFATKYGLQFPLASDEDHVVAEAYGTWVEKSMYGRTSMGMERSSFLVDGQGIIRNVWRRVKPATHAALVAEAFRDLSAGA
ncbi:thioredoxin-dependent thiol peroxidase [Gluconobacter aidae]|uniref:thioredoxin-dependent peroxiredoxin n=1 Tax=Gluconobacter aidae TaxID=2662454 RepID=A0A7X1SP33_9PROT|nr:thioredoxin-dependent thiol peroxidase [Gluconobacter aidae]MQR98568.1 thioredoxin-dependent thiol peroxidase [Gluconobacter aidae]